MFLAKHTSEQQKKNKQKLVTCNIDAPAPNKKQGSEVWDKIRRVLQHVECSSMLFIECSEEITDNIV